MGSRLRTPLAFFLLSFALQAQASPQPLGFVPVTPCRVADTRTAAGPFGGPSISGGSIRNFVIPEGACSVPPFAAAYSLNVTVVPHGGLGYLTIWPTGTAQPTVSTLNSLDGRIKANAAIVAAGAGGAVSIFATDSTDVVLDINGYFTSDPNASALAYYLLPPCRMLDTRQQNGPQSGAAFAAGEIQSISIVTSTCNVPSIAEAYFLNFTVAPPGPLGYITVWADGTAQPLVSTLNAPTGTVVANAAIVAAGSFGDINVFATNDTNLIIDISGYFAPPGQPGALAFYPTAPCRVADTRQNPGTFGAPSLPAGATRAFPIPQGSCAIPSNVQAYSLNATVVPAGILGYAAIWPSQDPMPATSTLNSFDGSIVSNAAVVGASTTGSINVFASNQTDLILDINGYFASQSGSVAPPAQPHTVQLSWYASISPNVIGYNVYRGGVSGGPYSLINTGLLPQTSYQDSDVTAGQTYYYVTTAVDSSNIESAFSNEAVVTVPTS